MVRRRRWWTLCEDASFPCVRCLCLVLSLSFSHQHNAHYIPSNHSSPSQMSISNSHPPDSAVRACHCKLGLLVNEKRLERNEWSVSGVAVWWAIEDVESESK